MKKFFLSLIVGLCICFGFMACHKETITSVLTKESVSKSTSARMADEVKEFYSYVIEFNGDKLLSLKSCKANKDNPTNMIKQLQNEIDVVFIDNTFVSPDLFEAGSNQTELKVLGDVSEDQFNDIYNHFKEKEIVDLYNNSSEQIINHVDLTVGQIIGIKSIENEVGLYLIEKIGSSVQIKACHY